MADQLNTKTFTLDAYLPRTDAKAFTETEEGDVIIEGWASDIGADRFGDVVVPGAFDDAIKSFLDDNPVLLYNHDVDRQLGTVLELDPREEGLWMKALIAAPTPGSWAEDVVNKVKRGMTRGLSVRGKMSRPYGRDAKSGQALVTSVDLSEISVTPLPVNPRTLFSVTQKAFGDPDDAASAAEAEAIRDYFDGEFEKVQAAYDKLLESTTKPENQELEQAREDLREQLRTIEQAISASYAPAPY